MKTFEDLKFKPHLTGDGKQSSMIFKNGYGVSVVRFKLPLLAGTFLGGRGDYGSYTSNEDEWELAVIKGAEGEWEITYDTPITDDVMGYLSEQKVTDVMKQVQELK